MNSILVFLAQLFFVGDEPCQTSTKLRGNFNVFTYNVDQGKPGSAVNGMVYVDQLHKRSHIEVRFGAISYKIIQLFEKRIQYIITGGICRATPVSEELQDISANSNTVSKGRTGTASDGLNIIRYTGITRKGMFVTTVTEKDCVPTSGVVTSKVKEEKYIGYVSFTDASTGFDDAVFNIPPECREAHGTRAHRSVEGILDSVNYIFQWSHQKENE